MSLEGQSSRWQIPPALWAAGIVFAAMSLTASILSQGFLEADACTHYLSARFALQQPHRLVSVWDRPLFMLLYSVPAALGGVVGARSVSLVLALLCAWCGWRIARALGMRKPELAFVLVLAQPLLFLHSLAEMTELCFAALIGLAFLAYMGKRWWWMAAAVAISPLGRPEGFGFVLLAAAALVMHRQWKWLWVLPVPLVLWTLTGWILWERPDYGMGPLNFLLWMKKNWPYSATSVYASGPLLFWQTQPNGEPAASFLLRLPILISPVIFPFMLLGVARLTSKWRGKLATHQGRCELLVVALPLGVLAGHSLLWWRGLMASSGELRYLLVTAPLWGVIAAVGWEWAFDRIGWKHVMAWAAAAALTPVLANCYMGVVPLKAYEDDQLARDVAQWYRGDAPLRRGYPRLTASYIAVYLNLDFSPTDRDKTVMWGKKMVRQNPPGVVLVWDPIYGRSNADNNMCVERDELIANGWRLKRTFTRGGRTWEAFLSREPLP